MEKDRHNLLLTVVIMIGVWAGIYSYRSKVTDFGKASPSSYQTLLIIGVSTIIGEILAELIKKIVFDKLNPLEDDGNKEPQMILAPPTLVNSEISNNYVHKDHWNKLISELIRMKKHVSEIESKCNKEKEKEDEEKNSLPRMSYVIEEHENKPKPQKINVQNHEHFEPLPGNMFN